MTTAMGYASKFYKIWSASSMIAAYIGMTIMMIYLAVLKEVTFTNTEYGEHVIEVFLFIFFIPGAIMMTAEYVRGVVRE